jgi:hypothetical protein
VPVLLSINSQEEITEEVVVSGSFKVGETKPLFLVVGIEFYQQVNGALYSLKNGQYNSVTLVKVSGMA